MCFMPKFIGHPLFTLANQGAQAAAKDVGDTVNYVGSTEIDASKQIEWINTCTQQGVDAIIVGALDPNALVPALNAAKAKGILTNTWDADVDPSARTLFFSTPTPEDLGQAMADMLGDAMGYEGKWAWLSSGPDVANQVAWINATEAYMKANAAKFAKMELVTTVYGESDDAKSYTAAEGLLARYPDLKGIISPDAAGLPAGARAIQDGSKCGKVFITGVALPSAMTTFVHAGCVKSFALWKMDDLGYLSVFLTHQYLIGAIKGDVGEVVQVGKLGERTIAAGKIIAVGKPLIYTIDNVDK
jgi:rhamnose transport system substrate-binding protein